MTKPPHKTRSRRRTIIRTSVTAAIVVVLVCFRMVSNIGREHSPEDRWRVVKIIDGDSMVLSGGEELRLANVDTPEEGELLFDSATQCLSGLVLGKAVRVQSPPRRRDKYGRLLGYVFVDSVMVGETILERGLGYLLLFHSSDLDRPAVQRLLAAQRRGLAARAGLHSKERTPEEYYISRYGRYRFHRPSCGEIKNLDPTRNRLWETREEALYEGLAPCRICKP